MANPVGQVLVQMAIEHAKPQKLVGKLCSLLIEVNKTVCKHETKVSCTIYGLKTFSNGIIFVSILLIVYSFVLKLLRALEVK